MRAREEAAYQQTDGEVKGKAIKGKNRERKANEETNGKSSEYKTMTG